MEQQLPAQAGAQAICSWRAAFHTWLTATAQHQAWWNTAAGLYCPHRRCCHTSSLGLLSQQLFASPKIFLQAAPKAATAQPCRAEPAMEQLSGTKGDTALGNLLCSTWNLSWWTTIINYAKGHVRYFFNMKQHRNNYKIYHSKADWGGVWLILLLFFLILGGCIQTKNKEKICPWGFV